MCEATGGTDKSGSASRTPALLTSRQRAPAPSDARGARQSTPGQGRGHDWTIVQCPTATRREAATRRHPRFATAAVCAAYALRPWCPIRRQRSTTISGLAVELGDAWPWLARAGAPIAAIPIPAAFFLSVASPSATRPNGPINPADLGAVLLTGGIVSLGFDASPSAFALATLSQDRRLRLMSLRPPYNGCVRVRWIRLAVILFLAVVATDLAGLDCSRLVASTDCTSPPDNFGTRADAPDCLCCSVADAEASVSAPARPARADRAPSGVPATTADGVYRRPYRPPLAVLSSSL